MSILTSQVEYNRFYDELKKYAKAEARQYSLGWEAIDTALDKVVDYIIVTKEVPSIALAHEIISNSLKSTPRNGQEAIDYPNVNILEIKDKKQRQICLLYWRDGLKQDEIAEEVGVDQAYVSRTLARFRK